VYAPRWLLQPDGPDSNGFDTWTSTAGRVVALEHDAPAAWTTGLAGLGHRLRSARGTDGTFGHAHAITIDPEGLRRAAADPRTRVGSAGGH
jgi:hypothetical protein